MTKPIRQSGLRCAQAICFLKGSQLVKAITSEVIPRAVPRKRDGNSA